MAVKKKFSGLGRGLDVLISTEDVVTSGSNTICEVSLDLIEANPNQPRREFSEEGLQELADSIKEIGIVQPITLRATDEGKYQIIAGERRWRASIRAGMNSIPAYIKTVDDKELMEMALVENIQREDLNPIEIALAYQHLVEKYGLTQEKLAERVGKKRATVANFMRLLKLPAPLQIALRNGTIDTGHARAILSLDDPRQQLKAYKEVVGKGMSVRMVEEFVKTVKEGDIDRKSVKPKSSQTPEIQSFRNEIETHLGRKVTVSCNTQGKGKITIAFDNIDQLKELANKIVKQI